MESWKFWEFQQMSKYSTVREKGKLKQSQTKQCMTSSSTDHLMLSEIKLFQK